MGTKPGERMTGQLERRYQGSSTLTVHYPHDSGKYCGN
jgi:hypothetical protein